MTSDGLHSPIPPSCSSPSMLDVQVPPLLQEGTVMLKVSAKKAIKTRVSWDYDRGQILWESKKGGHLNIESIREVRYGDEATYYRTQFKLSAQYQKYWLTIIYLSKKSNYKLLHLVSLEAFHYKTWKETLEKTLALRRELLGGLNHLRKRQAYWLKQHWKDANTTDNSKLEFQEVAVLCKKLNISVPESDIRAHFELADNQNRGYLDFQDFQRFVKLMKQRSDLEELFNRLTGGSNCLSQEQFIKFMLQVQKSNLHHVTLRSIYNKFLDDDAPAANESGFELLGPKQMSLDGFATFLQSSDNSAMNEDHLQVCQDMSLPLSDYFLATSHNTYLVGNQLKGESTVEGYIRALQQGCRSVELDCWDGDGGEPVVYHGRTLTSKLLLSEALKVVSKYAFVASPYPLILSLEVHCQPSQQDRIAELLISCLGEALLDKRLESDSKELLPSPKQLMYRILVKAKKQVVNSQQLSKPVDITAESENTTSTTSGSSTSSDSDLKRIISSASSVFGRRIRRMSSAISPSSGSHDRQLSIEKSPSAMPSTQSVPLMPDPNNVSRVAAKEKASVMPLTNALSSLIIYTIGVKAKGFNKITKYDVEHILSLSERTVNKFIRYGNLGTLDLIGHTKGHLTRAYPAATRVFSSNFLPNRFWAAGIQLVACNWQTYDLGMQINLAFFNQNGRSGYVLKPLPLRVKAKEKEAVIKPHEYELKLTIISIQQLPKHPSNSQYGIDPFVEIQMISPMIKSSKSSTSHVKRKTRVIKGNGFNPIYHENFVIPFEAPGGMIDLCFLRLSVVDELSKGIEDDGVVGSVCVSLGTLRPGYRHLPLYDDSGCQHFFASIFIKSELVKKTDL